MRTCLLIYTLPPWKIIDWPQFTKIICGVEHSCSFGQSSLAIFAYIDRYNTLSKKYPCHTVFFVLDHQILWKLNMIMFEQKPGVSNGWINGWIRLDLILILVNWIKIVQQSIYNPLKKDGNKSNPSQFNRQIDIQSIH